MSFINPNAKIATHAALTVSHGVADKIANMDTPNISGNTFDTIYQNSTRTRIITTSGIAHTGATGESAAAIVVQIGVNTPPETVVCYGGLDTSLANESIYFTNTFIVPPNYYYRVLTNTSGTGSIVKQTWIESDL